MKKLFLGIALLFLLAACTQSKDTYIRAEDGYAEGLIGDQFQTAFFVFSVDNAAFPESYEGLSPSSDMQLVLVTVSIVNTFGETLPMFNTDFQIQWHDLGDKEEDYSFAFVDEASATLMPETFSLKKDERVSYQMIYEVPQQARQFSIAFQEFFEDESIGDTFFVSFSR